MRIACVGGGPGLYFALLAKLGNPAYDITVFERTAADASQGWGVTFGRDLLRQLYRSDRESAQELDRAAFRQFDQVVDIHDRRVLHPGGGGYGISRRRLLDIVAERARGVGVQIEFEHEVAASSPPSADLIVACDGVNSRMRREAGQFQTAVREGGNKYVWLGTTKVFESFTYAFVPTDGGWIWAYGYGIGAGLSTFIVECSAQTWSRLGFDVMSAPDGISLLEQLFHRQLDDHPLLAREVQPGVSAGWLNFRTVTNQSWHDRNIVLAGDAAHTTHFTIGSGTTQAIEDAIALAGTLQRHHGRPQPALEAYERQRKAALMRMQSDAQLSAQWFESISRYLDLEPHAFAALLHGRRSPLLPHLPPRLYYRLHQATAESAVLGELRRRAAPTLKGIYSQRRVARPPGGSATREYAERRD